MCAWTFVGLTPVYLMEPADCCVTHLKLARLDRKITRNHAYEKLPIVMISRLLRGKAEPLNQSDMRSAVRPSFLCYGLSSRTALSR